MLAKFELIECWLFCQKVYNKNQTKTRKRWKNKKKSQKSFFSKEILLLENCLMIIKPIEFGRRLVVINVLLLLVCLHQINWLCSKNLIKNLYFLHDFKLMVMFGRLGIRSWFLIILHYCHTRLMLWLCLIRLILKEFLVFHAKSLLNFLILSVLRITGSFKNKMGAVGCILIFKLIINVLEKSGFYCRIFCVITFATSLMSLDVQIVAVVRS